MRLPASLASLFIGLSLSLCAYPETLAAAPCALPDNTLITAAGSPAIYFLHDAKKYYIQSPKWITDKGYGGEAVHVLKPSEMAAIPSGYDLAGKSAVPGTPASLENKLVWSGGKIYVVTQGQRHWVLDPRWISQSRYAGQAAVRVSAAELQALPVGTDIMYFPPGTKIRVLSLSLAIFAFFYLSTNNNRWHFSQARFSSLARSKFFQIWTTWHTRAILLIAFCAAIVAREPYLLAHPRFWAEEGTVWFQFASSHSVIQTILFVYPLSRYFNLTANIGAVLSSVTAARVGLEYAPAATTFLAFLIQALALALILFGRSRLFDSHWKRVTGCLIVLFAPTATDEIWLNSINSMSYLGLISLLLLFEETRNRPGWQRWILRGALLVCGLSSPYTIALLPLFVGAAVFYKMPEQKIQCLILLLCVLLQAGIVARTSLSGAQASRGTDLRLDASMVNMFSEHVAHPSLGDATLESLTGEMGLKDARTTAASFPPHPASTSLRVAGWLCFILLAAIVWSLKGRTIYGAANQVLAAFLILSVFTCLASIHSVPVGRYAFLPGLAFLFLLLINADSSKSRLVRYICMLVLSYGLANGIKDYPVPSVQSGPSWSKEVRIWRNSHAHRLRVWPEFWAPEGGGIVYNNSLQR